VFTYYLKDSLKTRKQQRREKEKKLEKAGKPVPFPGWDQLRLEDREDKPAVIITITDADGQVVRRLTGPVSKGIHRKAWDLRYPSIDPVKLDTAGMQSWERPARGPLVVPGTFHVQISKWADGVLTSLGSPRTFKVESLALATLPAKDRKELLVFQAKAGELQRAMMGAGEVLKEAERRLKFIQKALLNTPNASPQLGRTVFDLQKRLLEIRTGLYGDRTIRRSREATSPSLMRRLSRQLNSTGPITAGVKRNYEIAAAGFSSLLEKLRELVDRDLKKLQEELEAAGAPWTPGRGVPTWKK
jgi:hypothetical protein